jgi:hypothetical protein
MHAAGDTAAKLLKNRELRNVESSIVLAKPETSAPPIIRHLKSFK